MKKRKKYGTPKRVIPRINLKTAWTLLLAGLMLNIVAAGELPKVSSPTIDPIHRTTYQGSVSGTVTDADGCRYRESIFWSRVLRSEPRPTLTVTIP